eukprot:3941419-Rhodomonas_salina.1
MDYGEAISGTDMDYGDALWRREKTMIPRPTVPVQVSAYARPTPCPIACAAIGLGPCYAMPGTDLAHGATSRGGRGQE